jgi:hypothetical protein
VTGNAACRKLYLAVGVALAAAVVLVGACSPEGPLVATKSPNPRLASASPSAASTGPGASPAASASPSAASTGPGASPAASPSPLAPGNWQLAAPMSTPRTDFAAVALPDGRVLLVGGQVSKTAATASAELFDVAANAMKPVAPMSTARNGLTATLLANRTVLVAGGTSSPSGTALATAEIYDPATNAWRKVASMARPRAHHAAILLGDGKVFVVGGDGGTYMGDPTSPEVYDPSTDTWTSVARFPWGDRPRGPAITVLADGRVFVYGGFAIANLGDSVPAYYDPATGQASGSYYGIDAELAYTTVAQLRDGSVFIVGGQQVYDQAAGLSQVMVYDVSKERGCQGCNPWSTGPSMNVGHCQHTMTQLPSGNLLVAGGRCGQTESIQVTELYDQAGKAWFLVAPLGQARGDHVAVLLSDGRVLVSGGLGIGGRILNSTEIYTAG